MAPARSRVVQSLSGNLDPPRQTGPRIAGRGSRGRVRERVRVGFAGGGKRAAGRSREPPTLPLTLMRTLAERRLALPDTSHLRKVPANAYGEGTLPGYL
jgi:hypothetical protein